MPARDFVLVANAQKTHRNIYFDVYSEAGYLKFSLKLKRKFYHIGVWPRGYKTLFMLNSTEHEISAANKN